MGDTPGEHETIPGGETIHQSADRRAPVMATISGVRILCDTVTEEPRWMVVFFVSYYLEVRKSNTFVADSKVAWG